MAKKCPACGYKNSDSAAACIQCGSSLYDSDVFQPSPSSPTTPQPAVQTGSQLPITVRSSVLPSVTTLLSWIFLAFIFALNFASLYTFVSIAIVIAIGISLSALLRKKFEFYDDFLKITNRFSLREVQYSQVSDVSLIRGRILLSLKGKIRGVLVPSNPRLQDGDLYGWLKQKIQSKPETDAPVDAEQEI